MNELPRKYSDTLDLRITDTSLRDGSHHKRHQFTSEEVRSIVAALDEAGVPVIESAGALVLEQVSDRVLALKAELGDDAMIGFHGHENLGLAVANSVLAARAGATQIDGSARRFGAGAGNTPVEAFVGVCDKLGIKTGIDFFAIADAAEDVVRPAM